MRRLAPSGRTARRVRGERGMTRCAFGCIHCGKCGTCVERREAFLISGVPDPTEYLETGPLPEKPQATL